MSKTTSDNRQNPDELLPEYRFDYRKAKPNRFATSRNDQKFIVVLDDDVAQHFKTSESVNQALRELIQSMPESANS